MKGKTEILAPCGDYDCFLSAVNNGADAVYLGLKNYSARSGAANFDDENLRKLICRAKLLGVKVYVAVNTLVKNCELDGFADNIARAYALGADAFILQDVFLGEEIKRQIPEITLHLSTQAGVCNAVYARYARDMGFSRVIAARETPLDELKKISEIIETEAFCQGALCSSFSGHCYFSSFIGGNSGNRGKCLQPCRRKYSIEGYNADGEYAISLADLCLKDRLSDLIAAGVSSFKIEGRMRSPEYVGAAVRLYRDALDGKSNASEFSDLKRTYNRGDYTEGYIDGVPENIISRRVQSHKGECVSRVKQALNGILTLDGAFTPHVGDGFKILRGGFETGGAVAQKKGDGVIIACSGDVKRGDEVCITKDTALQSRILSARRQASVKLNIDFNLDQAKVVANTNNCRVEKVVSGFFVPAVNAALTAESVKECFSKIDENPFLLTFERVSVQDGLFCAKSALNALRRSVYEELIEKSAPRRQMPKLVFDCSPLPNKCEDKLVVRAQNFDFIGAETIDVAVFSTDDYNNDGEFDNFFAEKRLKGQKLLFVPAYITSADIALIGRRLKGFDGLFVDSALGLALGRELGCKVMLGVGANVFNSVDNCAITREKADFCISKELTLSETKELSGSVFRCGSIALMELCYCPYGHTCGNCRGRNLADMTDFGGRKFALRRYKLNGCRFEVYNCALLVSGGKGYYDFTALDKATCQTLIASGGKDCGGRPSTSGYLGKSPKMV